MPKHYHYHLRQATKNGKILSRRSIVDTTVAVFQSLFTDTILECKTGYYYQAR